MSLGIRVMLLFVGVSPYPMWQNIYDGSLTDKGHGLCLDSANRVVIVGETNQASDYDCWMIVVSKSGDSLWSRIYDEGGSEQGFGVTTTRNGALCIAALIDENTVGTILYDEDGDLLWKRQNRGDEVAGILATPEQKVFTAYWYISLERYYVTVCGYNHQGDAVYYASQRVLDGDVTDIAVDSFGYVYLGDRKSIGCSLWKFSPEGDIEWRRFYNNNATRGFALVMNDAGYLFHAGDIAAGSTIDFLLLKWNTSGRLFWDPGKNYNLGAYEYCRDIKLDSISDCYLAGYQVRGSERDPAIVKTDSAGNMLWGWVDTLEGDQEIEGIEVDADGYIYLAGSHHNGSNWDMLVMKVCQPLTITGRVTDSVGKPMEGIPVSLTGDTTVEVLTDTGGYYFIEVYNGGEYTVSPNLPGWSFTPSSRTYSPLAHREFDQDFEGSWTAVTEKPVTHSIRLEANASEICFTLPHSSHIRLALYDACGREVTIPAEGSYVSGTHQLSMPDVEAGVYFVRLQADASTVSRKLVVLEQ